MAARLVAEANMPVFGEVSRLESGMRQLKTPVKAIARAHRVAEERQEAEITELKKLLAATQRAIKEAITKKSVSKKSEVKEGSGR